MLEAANSCSWNRRILLDLCHVDVVVLKFELLLAKLHDVLHIVFIFSECSCRNQTAIVAKNDMLADCDVDRDLV